MKVGVAPVLKKALLAHNVRTVDIKAKSATGLSRPDYYDWPSVASDLLKTPTYDTVIMMIGANDCQAIKDEAGVEHRFNSPEWRAAYAARVRRMAGLLCDQDRKVFWLGLPPMEKKAFNKRIRKLDTFLAETLAASGSCVRYLPTKDVLGGDNGKFAERLLVKRHHVRVREPDGIHITQSGGALVADLVLKQLGPALSMPQPVDLKK
jgi:hypothetical protein